MHPNGFVKPLNVRRELTLAKEWLAIIKAVVRLIEIKSFIHRSQIQDMIFVIDSIKFRMCSEICDRDGEEYTTSIA